MKKVNLLIQMAILGVIALSIFSCNSPNQNEKKTTEMTTTSNQTLFSFKLNDIDRPDWDSSISIKDAQDMMGNYNKDARKFKFNYHDPTDSNHLKEGIMQGFIFNTKTIQEMITSSGCSKIYVAFGIHFRNLGNGKYDTLLTTIMLPVNKGTNAGSFSIVTKNLTGGDQTGSEFSTPCPPYCPQ
jgi:hypothetical protein